MNPSKFGQLRVLLVEDESLVAMLIEDALHDLGCAAISVASTLDEALRKASSSDFDIAILDVNLNGAPAFPVAELLARRRVPFVFSTGYGVSGVPESFRTVPILAKPFKENEVERALEAAMASRQRLEAPDGDLAS